MKVIYQANDGTKFDKESNCKEYEIACSVHDKAEEELESKRNALIALASDYDCDWDGILIDSQEGANFIVENIQEINRILDTGSEGCSCVIFHADVENYKQCQRLPLVKVALFRDR